VFGDGCRQLRDGGEIQLAADHDRCQLIVALDGDLERPVALVAKGHAGTPRFDGGNESACDGTVAAHPWRFTATLTPVSTRAPTLSSANGCPH
jgi:hypothetical protein